MRNICKDILFGVAVGDALGVPVEFKSRETIARNPVTDMIGYGTHRQPAGTWSDDSSLSFCLAESLCDGYNLDAIASKFVKWLDEGYWTPYGEVFDIGNTTRKAINNLKNGCEPILAGETGDYSNGNGSLMRILPLLPQLIHLPFEERYQIIKDVSSITHRHPRSILGCVLLMEFALNLLHKDPLESLRDLSLNFNNYLENYPELGKEIHHYNRLLDGMSNERYDELKVSDPQAYESIDFNAASVPSIATVGVDTICSGGYVVDTLEASIWCLINSTNYKDAVLLAVNLGDDTDTTGAVTGGLAALYYGFESIPENWINQLARRDDIEKLSIKLNKYYQGI
ncbi:MAG: ADP-ribosylglycohydrolase family protein [Mariniphaga sp.]